MAGIVASSAAPAACDRTRVGMLALLTAAVAALALRVPDYWHAFVLLLASPTVEEAILRTGLHEDLLRNRMRPWLANACAAAAFCAAHAAVRGTEPQVLFVMAPALVIGAAYNRWRSLPVCVAIHAASNALWIGGVHGMFA